MVDTCMLQWRRSRCDDSSARWQLCHPDVSAWARLPAASPTPHHPTPSHAQLPFSYHHPCIPVPGTTPDYDRRDTALQHLIQPLAGEYGLAIGQPLMKTHRRLFAEWYESVMHEPLAALLGEGAAPVHSLKLFSKMIGDIQASHWIHTLAGISAMPDICSCPTPSCR